VAIQSFKCKLTKAMFDGAVVPRFANFQSVAMRKLAQLNAAGVLNDLRVPPGNMLEALGGDRKGQHSIRVNQQFRVCFVWSDRGPTSVEIVDYH
jgi:proteic killer suppression protein